MANEIGTPPPAAAAPDAGAGGTVGRPATLQDIAEAEAKKQGVDPRLVHAVISTESSYNPSAVNKQSGATGLMQLMPATAKRWGVDAADPVQNIRGGVSELKSLLDQHQGDVVMALRRYNGSPTVSDAATQPYVDKVLGQLKPGQGGGVTDTGQPINPQNPPAGTPAPAPAPAPVGDGRGMGPGAGAPPKAATPPTAGTPPPAPPESWTQWGVRHGKELLQSFDPRTAGGRQNLMGAAGAAGATALVAGTAPVTAPVAGLGLATAGVLGAIGGGMTSEAGEQLAGTKPPSGEAALTAGAVQGGQEAIGHGLMWPVQAVGRRLIASRVGRFASEGLTAAKTATLDRLSGALETAQTAYKGAKTAAKAAGEAGITDATEAAAKGEAAARAPYDKLVGTPPPSAAAAGRATNEVIQHGGAAEARNMAGRAVDEAAASGPAVSTQELKAQAQQIVEGQIRPPEQSFPRKSAAEIGAVEDEGLASALNMDKGDFQALKAQAAADPTSAAAKRFELMKANASEFMKGAAPDALSEAQSALVEAQGEAGKDTLKHPAMGILNRILNAPDTVPFRDMHLWKVELDNAIRNTRDQSVKSQVQALTQKFAGSLRSTLKAAGHAPYEEASQAYAQIAPLYTKGHAAALKKVAVESPESIVTMIRPNQPTKAKMLVDLLTHQAAEGGDREGGQQALEAVQSAWVRKNVIDGGLEKMGARLDKIPPEFRQAFLGDAKSQQVLDNLKLIHTAYQTAVQQGERGVEAATAAAKAGVDTAKVDAARQAIPAAELALQQRKRTFRQQEKQLAKSSLAPSMRPGAAEQAGADVLRAAALGPGSIWGGLSAFRLLKGPTANDLIHWAAASPTGTRAFVKAVTSSVPATALADLVRSSGILEEAPRTGKKSVQSKGSAAQPSRANSAPPAAAVGSPPPPS